MKETAPAAAKPANKWRNRIFQVLLVLVIFFGIQQFMKRDLASGPAPQLAAVQLDGRAFDLAGTPRQAPLLVHFWATWCPVCTLEQDSIQSIAQGHDVITVAMQSGDDQTIQAHMQENELSFPVINDKDGEMARDWQIIGVPATFIVDSEGVIRFAEVGFTTGLGLRARLWLADLL